MLEPHALFHELLQRHWGYERFRPLQEDIISSVYDGHDTVALLPTGGGKSITYQIAGLARGGLTLVITPLIALMEDQVRALQARGIRATAIHSGLGRLEIARRFEGVESGAYAFLYLSPERLTTEQSLASVGSWGVNLLAVDEAHCISQWGHDFRPNYRRIAEVRPYLPEVPILAVTATATPHVAEDIETNLTLRAPRHFRATFQRQGLQYAVRETHSPNSQLRHILANMAGTAIVYVRQRAMTESIALDLTMHGVKALAYHAGMSPEERKKRQEAWMCGEVRVMVSTNAFGMGIDKPDVRLVCHVGLPSSLEEYYQEAGRGGRDGNGALAVLFYSPEEIVTQRHRFKELRFSRETLRTFYAALLQHCFDGRESLYGVAAAPFSPQEFLSRHKQYLVQFASWLQVLQNSDYVRFATPPRSEYVVSLSASPSEIERVRCQDSASDALFQLLLGQLPEEGVYTLPRSLLERTFHGRTENGQILLARLAQQGYLRYAALGGEVGTLSFLTDDDSLEGFDLPYWQEVHRLTELRYEGMVDYARHAAICREVSLRRYFGEKVAPSVDDCGRCDVCMGRS